MDIANDDTYIKGSWVECRPEIKIFDCTIRDGGLMNDHRFDDALVKTVYATCVAAGIQYMEIGYKASKKIFAPTGYGAWKFCDENDIRRIVGENKTDLKLCAMADAERTDYHTDILPKDKSVLDCIRVATYIHQIPTAIDMIKDAHDKGYETALNIMAVSTVHEQDLRDAIRIVAQSPVDTLYLVDSFGAFFPKRVRDLTVMFLDMLQGTGKEVGIHAHNNQQLAFANTIEGMTVGANRLDATIGGMGRGAGNCALEMLLGFLKNPRFDIRPVLACVQNVFLPLQQTMNWGYSVPYMITGQLNQHPRSAIKAVAEKTDYVSFYDQMIEEG
jgi:4-hydroxy 2-oxovalerate aldolase